MFDRVQPLVVLPNTYHPKRQSQRALVLRASSASTQLSEDVDQLRVKQLSVQDLVVILLVN